MTMILPLSFKFHLHQLGNELDVMLRRASSGQFVPAMFIRRVPEWQRG